MVALFMFCGGLLLLDRVWDRLWPGPTSAVEWIVGGTLFLAPVFGLALVNWRAERRLRTVVRARGGAVCTECGYDLSGCDEPGDCPHCPECGAAWTLKGLRTRWMAAGVLEPDVDLALGRPFRARHGRVGPNPGRCPGLRLGGAIGAAEVNGPATPELSGDPAPRYLTPDA